MEHLSTLPSGNLMQVISEHTSVIYLHLGVMNENPCQLVTRPENGLQMLKFHQKF